MRMLQQLLDAFRSSIVRAGALMACALIVVSPGCMRFREKPRFAGPLVEIVWPPPPAAARIQFVRVVEAGGGLSLRQSRLARVLTGRQEVRLSRPYGVAVDKSGRLYVADTDAPAVLVYDYPGRQIIRVVEFDGQGFVSPIGVALGPSGTFYVTDSSLLKVLVFDQNGAFVQVFAPDTPMKRPTGIAVEPGTGRVLVVDTLANSVLVFNPQGKHLRTIGSTGQLHRPTDVWCDARGRVFVTDTLNFRVVIFRISDGAFLRTFGLLGDGSGAIRDPRGVAVDRHGNVYLVDRAFSKVQIFDDQGRFLLAFGEPGRGPGQFNMPSDIFIDDNDLLYISDSFNGRVQVFRLLGTAEYAAAEEASHEEK